MPAFRRTTLLGSKGTKQEPRKEIKNIVIFGETGVGKSSLINLIADENISKTSSGAAGCTLEYKRHLLKLGDQHFAMWDTAGLDEGAQGSVPAEKAEAYLKQLLHDLAKTGGIDLLVYCVRGTRVRSALLTNYHLFYSAICRRKVPIAIVITGLENQEGNMDTWWLKNGKQFSALQMYFDDYACVTTLKPLIDNPGLKERRRISRSGLIKMITTTCRTEQWIPAERSWVDTAFSDIRSMLSPRDTEHGLQNHITNVIMCDTSRYDPVGKATFKRSLTFHNPITLSFSLAWSMNFRSPVSIMNETSQSMLPFDDAMKCTPERLFHVYHVPQKQAPSKHELDGMIGADTILRRGADLLIFCVKKRDEGDKDVRLQWEHFNRTYGGELSPQIVVVIGATDQHSAEEWWRHVIGGAAGKSGEATIAYWPTSKSVAETDSAKRRLRYLVNTCCIDCSKVNFTGCKQFFRSTTTSRSNKSPVPLWTKSPIRRNTLKMDTSIDNQPDVLTKWGVWEHISVGR